MILILFLFLFYFLSFFHFRSSPIEKASALGRQAGREKYCRENKIKEIKKKEPSGGIQRTAPPQNAVPIKSARPSESGFPRLPFRPEPKGKSARPRPKSGDAFFFAGFFAAASL